MFLAKLKAAQARRLLLPRRLSSKCADIYIYIYIYIDVCIHIYIYIYM